MVALRRHASNWIDLQAKQTCMRPVSAHYALIIPWYYTFHTHFLFTLAKEARISPLLLFVIIAL